MRSRETFELSDFNELMVDPNMKNLSNDFNQLLVKQLIFYYDETNNIRKLWLDTNDFNAPIDNDFVLGGIMHFGNSFVFDFDSLKKNLRVQKSTKELKFKHITKKTDFLSCLDQSKVQIFLQWLYQSELYLHYSTTNNLYFTLTDIIDDIEGLFPDPMLLLIMKNELYKLALSNYTDFYQILKNYGYPNISNNSIALFFQAIVNLIDTSTTTLTPELKYLRHLLIYAKHQASLVFLQNNPKNIILNDYHSLYLRPLGIFPNAYHLFDHEYLIEEQFKQYKQICYDGIKFENYSFIDSKDSSLIQLSDCIIALVGKYHTFINNLDHSNVLDTLNSLNALQKSNLKLFTQIILKSTDISALFIHSICSYEARKVEQIVMKAALLFNASTTSE